MKKKRAVIFGFKKIGRRLYEKLAAKGWEIVFVATSKYLFTDDLVNPKDDVKNWQKYCIDIDVAFLAISTVDDGFIALKIIKVLRERNIWVETCEKGALGNYFDELKPMMSGIGYSATVGGGSGILHSLKDSFSSDTQEVHAILNGTMNYSFHDLSLGNPPGYIAEEIKNLKFAEGDGNLAEIIMAEAKLDATKKSSILFNVCFKSQTILRAKDIIVNLTEEMVRKAMREAMNRRFVVSFYRQEKFIEEPTDILAFCHTIDGWVIKGGFVKMENPYIVRLCNATPWVHNSILTIDGDKGADGTSLHVGLGAGPSTTSAAMIRGAEEF